LRVSAPSRDASDAPSRDASDAPSRDASDAPSRDASDAPSRDASDAPSRDAFDAPSRDVSDAPSRDAQGDGGAAPLVVMLSAAHPAEDIRIVRKEGAALAAAGWRVRHVCPDIATRGATGGRAALDGVALAPYRRRGGWAGRLLGFPALVRRAARSGAAVLHAHEPDAWFAALIAARATGARVVIDVHEHYPSRLDTRLPKALRPAARAALAAACRLAARGADAVVLARDGLAGDFSAHPRLVPVRNHALPVPPAPRPARARPLTLVHLGVLGRTRGALLLPELLAKAPAGTRLRLVGRFTDDSEAAFHARAAALGVAGRIDDLGWQPQEALPAALAEADIGLVLFQPVDRNHRLALPHKLFDYMLAGLPVIAPDFAPETAAVVREAGCGLLADTADAGAVAAAVAALADPARRAALGQAGRAAALGRFGWPAEAARLVALYRDLAPLPAV
jgi:glycosyltransferase involved in cell wall biosynthesis